MMAFDKHFIFKDKLRAWRKDLLNQNEARSVNCNMKGTRKEERGV